MIVTDVLRAVLIGLIPCSVSVEAFTVELIYALVFLHAMASAVFGPALTASVPFLVARRQFTAANALLQSTTSLGIVLGPALSGIGIAALSSQEVLCVNAVTYLISAACLLPIGLVHAPLTRRNGNSPVSTARDLVEGIPFAFVEQRMILLLMLMAALYTFEASAFAALLPVFGRNMLDMGPVEVGYLWSALGVGLSICLSPPAGLPGLTVRAQNSTILFSNPLLPEFPQEITITSIKIGPASIDLSLQHYAHDVGIYLVRREGAIDILVRK